MRILLTNDDGVHAEGLVALQRIAAELSDDVWTVAPETEQSGMSRALTLTAPLRVRRLSPRVFAVAGTPTDCVMLAFSDLIEGAPPDLVLSGVNRGQNIAEDVTMAGTVAGAIQAMALGVPGVALSQSLTRFHDDVVAHWATAEAYAPALIRQLLACGWPKDVVININFPARLADAVTQVEVTSQGFYDAHRGHAEKRTDLRGREYYWMGFRNRRADPVEGTDLSAMAEGRISVTPLHIDLTHAETLQRLRRVLETTPTSSRGRG